MPIKFIILFNFQQTYNRLHFSNQLSSRAPPTRKGYRNFLLPLRTGCHHIRIKFGAKFIKALPLSRAARAATEPAGTLPRRNRIIVI